MGPEDPTTETTTMPTTETTTETTTMPTTETTTMPSTETTTMQPVTTKPADYPGYKACRTCQTMCAPCQACQDSQEGKCYKCWHCWDYDDDELEDDDDDMDKDCDAMHKDHDWDADEVRCLTNEMPEQKDGDGRRRFARRLGAVAGDGRRRTSSTTPLPPDTPVDCRACWSPPAPTPPAPEPSPQPDDAACETCCSKKDGDGRRRFTRRLAGSDGRRRSSPACQNVDCETCPSLPKDGDGRRRSSSVEGRQRSPQ